MTYALMCLSVTTVCLLLELRATRRHLSAYKTAYTEAAYWARRQADTAAYWQTRCQSAERKRVWTLNDLMRGEA